ncbi:MAG: hypothetical protein IT204_08595 [Fimbriimonadaceae bacterium]|nr:hypothetical protein [Fimbriimonadaceae bacterium]
MADTSSALGPAAEVQLLRDLARRYRDVTDHPVQTTRRDLWRAHNSLRPTRPLIYTRAFAFGELPDSQCVCTDGFLRGFEHQLRYQLCWAELDDDCVFEPWLNLSAVHRCAGWGVPYKRHTSSTARGSYKPDHPIKTEADVANLLTPRHELDEAATAQRWERAQGIFEGLLEVNLDRGPAYRVWTADLSTDLGHLRGIEHFMLDMIDRPEWFHALLRHMSDGVLRTHEQAEAAGDWGLGCHQNQAMPYAEELPDPAPNTNGVARRQLWVFLAAQEYTAVSPAMHEEFLLRYQMPILSAFGLSAYGCCEDLTRKIDLLRSIPNLRRIGVSPMANVARCAEQIGRDYVLSYRPSPTDMVGYGFDVDRVRRILREDFAALRDTCFDITLKDVETVQGDRDRVRQWVRIVRQELERAGLAK